MSNESAEKKGFKEGFWSQAEIQDIFLDKQRRIFWNKDYWRNVLVPLLKLRQDSVILDVGCGLGFIGQSLAEFVPHGKVIGVDLDPKLIEAARMIATKKYPDRVFDYRVGSAYELPLEDDSVDLSVCQCVMMHLDNPAKAISEMQRVTKRDGRVVAIEPDYSSLGFFDTAFERMGYTVDDRVKFWRWEIIRKMGKKKLGKGDDDIGSRMPYLFLKSGLRVAEVRCFDRVFWLVPPYMQEGNDIELEQMLIPPEFYMNTLDMRGDFFAGGGTEEEFKGYLDLMKKEHEVRQGQIKEKTFISSWMQALIITIGEKT